ncbi:MAG: hypothetical protein ACQEUH_11870 [Pseudomonadota bacterium]
MQFFLERIMNSEPHNILHVLYAYSEVAEIVMNINSKAAADPNLDKRVFSYLSLSFSHLWRIHLG